jgi:HK97 family phage major capsid protein
MTDEQQPTELELPVAEVTVRSAAKRELDVRLAPFDTVIETIHGPEVIVRGAFAGTNPDDVLLMGLEHEVHLGLGQDGKVTPVRRPIGRALSIEERDDAAYGTFRVAKTAAGDEALALAEAGVVRGVSIEMGRDARVRTAMHNGRRTQSVEFADLRALSPTYKPAYATAAVMAVRSQQEDAPVATEEQAPDAGATEGSTDLARYDEVSAARSSQDVGLLQSFAEKFNRPIESIVDRLEKIEERARSGFSVPAVPAEKAEFSMGEWTSTAIRLLTGERIPPTSEQYRIVAELVTTDNAGVVPDAFSDRIIGVIDPRRPFMATTERIPTPESGMQLVVPKIVTRPTVARQVAEKDELSSTATSITTESFNVQTYGGVGDISIQLLKRSDPSFLELYLRLLAEAYAIETEEAAVAALIAAINDGGPEPATALNPNALNLGAAFQTSFNAIRRGPDTIWMSSEAVAEFIDAKASGTNQALYGDLGGNFTVNGGPNGTIHGLRAVHVPALDNKGAYAIVGPSDGFAWAEDGTYTLQVDVPSKAGRDVALVGMVWHAPWYPEAFSLFNVAS